MTMLDMALAFGLLVALVALLILTRRMRKMEERERAISSKMREHDAGFHRILNWQPDEGGIVRSRGQ